MQVGRPNNPFMQQPTAVRSPQAGAASATAATQMPKDKGLRVQGDSMKKASAALQPPPSGLDAMAMITFARSLAFPNKHFDRGARLGSEGFRSHRSPSGPNPLLGSYEGRGSMSAPGAHVDISTSHPLYGGALKKYQDEMKRLGKEVRPGKLLLQMFRHQVGDKLKNTIRRTL
jgi:hypothetical protein